MALLPNSQNFVVSPRFSRVSVCRDRQYGCPPTFLC